MRSHKSLLQFAGAFALLGAAACGGDPVGSTADPARDAEPREIGDGYAGGELPTYPELEIPEDAPKVAFLGDSITAGLHLGPEHAFPAEVQRRLAAAGQPFRLQNAGVSGDTSRGGFARLAWLLRGEPDVVVIGLGANDGLRGQSAEAVEENLRAIVTGVREVGATPILLGMDVPTNLAEYAAAFGEIYPRIAADMNVPFVPRFLDGVGGVPELNLPDGLHPTVEGHVRLAENVAPVLARVLAED